VVRSYRASIILRNIRGDGQTDYGNVGVIYNVHDDDNFDFVLLRIRYGIDARYKPVVTACTLY